MILQREWAYAHNVEILGADKMYVQNATNEELDLYLEANETCTIQFLFP